MPRSEEKFSALAAFEIAAEHRRHHSGCIGKRSKGQDENQRSEVQARAVPAYRRTRSIFDQVMARANRNDSDILVGTCLDAIKAKRAIHVSRFSRLKKLELAAALRRISLDAVERSARGTDIRMPDLHLKR